MTKLEWAIERAYQRKLAALQPNETEALVYASDTFSHKAIYGGFDIPYEEIEEKANNMANWLDQRIDIVDKLVPSIAAAWRDGLLIGLLASQYSEPPPCEEEEEEKGGN